VISKNSFAIMLQRSVPVLISPLAGLEIALAIPPVNMRRRNMAADARRRCRGRNSARERQRWTPKGLRRAAQPSGSTPGVSARGWRSEGTESIEVYQQMVSYRSAGPGPRVILLSLAVATARLQLVRFQLALSNLFPKNSAQGVDDFSRTCLVDATVLLST
jgi:hypothetical protein